MFMNKHKETWQSWSSWSSPVGLGIFYLTSALAAAIVIYTLLNLAGTVAELAHPAPSYSYPTTDASGAPTLDTTGAGTSLGQ